MFVVIPVVIAMITVFVVVVDSVDVMVMVNIIVVFTPSCCRPGFVRLSSGFEGAVEVVLGHMLPDPFFDLSPLHL